MSLQNFQCPPDKKDFIPYMKSVIMAYKNNEFVCKNFTELPQQFIIFCLLIFIFNDLLYLTIFFKFMLYGAFFATFGANAS